MCEVIIDGETVEFEGSVLTEKALKPYQGTAREIRICDSVAEIKSDAFFKFKNLKNVEISNSVKVIGETVFWECSALKTIAFPNSITELRYGVCKNCQSLENVVIPESVQIIGDYAFKECITLKNIRIPDSVTDIGNGAFLECTSLENVTIPNSVATIGRDVFVRCSSLKDIIIPKSVVKIGNYVFWESGNIRVKIEAAKNVITPESLMGMSGQIITVDIEGDEYPILTHRVLQNEKVIVITSFVDYADGKLYRGYEFDEELDSQSKVPLYCYCDAFHSFCTSTLSELKTLLEETSIR